MPGRPPNTQRATFAPQYQAQPAPVYPAKSQPVHQGYAASHTARPLIVDPPRRISVPPISIQPQPQTSGGFPSPGRDYGFENRKFHDDLSRITLSFQQGIPEAVRRAVRDNWEKCLLGSEFHQAFVLNAAVHHSSATPGIQSRAIRDFGAVMVSNCKQEIVEKWSTRDIDDVAPALLAKASNAFLDQCLALRLQTIDAKPLLNALAKAERLGYEPNDILLEQQERVIPNHQLNNVPPANTAGPAASTVQRARLDQFQCLQCFRTFAKKSYYDYHLTRSVCTKVPPTAEGFRHSCPKCGQGFTQNGGLAYHMERGVCEPSDYVPPVQTPATAAAPATPAALPSHMRGYATPTQNTSSTKSTPTVPASTYTRAAASPTDRTGPYAHLSAQDFEAMQADLRDAEITYAPRFREAEAIEDPDLKQKKLDSLRNTFGTKQSIIRKKYGVRLRERRTKAEIQAERERMGLPTDTTPSSQPSTQYSYSQVQPPTHGHQPAPTASAWAAANKRPLDTADEASPASKRQRSEVDLGPTTKVSEMAGGLTASAADAAVHDPTLPSPRRAASSAAVPASQPAITYEQSGARVEVHMPVKAASSSPAKPNEGENDGNSDIMIIEKQLAEELQDQDNNNNVEAIQYDGAGDHDEGDNVMDEDEHNNERGEEVGEQENEDSEQEGEDIGQEKETKDEADEAQQQEQQDLSDSDSDSDDSDDEDIPPALPSSSGRSGLSQQGHRLGM